MNLILMATSLRQGSINKKLINVVADILQQKNVNHELLQFNDYMLPLYDGDIEVKDGIPENAKKFIEKLNAADGFILSTPEYNFSIPGTTKNFIDWVSRDKPMPWRDKHIFLLSASPSMVGGNRSVWNTRVPLECNGAFVYPDMYSLANAYNEFTDDGQLKDENRAKRLENTIQGFINSLC